MADSTVRIAALSARVQEIAALSLDGVIVAAIVKYLQESEAKLMQLLDGERPPDSDPGSVEFGLMLYWLKNSEILHPLWDLLGKPEPKITGAMLAQWETLLRGAGALASDGTLLAFSKYAQLDFGVLTDTPGSHRIGWAEVVIDYIYYLILPKKIHPFGTDGTSVHFSGSQLSIAILGDWGTGVWTDGTDESGPATVLLDQAVDLKPPPDLTVHLGDVYYVGSQGQDGTENPKFVDLWKPGAQGSFTLNSNHEMYPGAKGYFEDAMKSKLFSQQNKASYFAIEFGTSWTVIGLDSAYDAKFPENTLTPLYMEGRITDSTQLNFVNGLDLTGRQVIVLTHHNPVTTDGQLFYGKLWSDVTGALNANKTFTSANGKGAPQYWYWGHVHNGIVYNENSACGKEGTQGRCSGHSAIPFGSAYGLIDDNGSFAVNTVDYVAHTPYSEYAKPTVQQQKRVLNGFTVLTLKETGICEEWYEQGNGSPVWPSPKSS